MTSIGSFEAKTHLPQLLRRVSHGERILITKRGRPVAMLVPAPQEGQKDLKQVVKEMLEQRDRDGPTLGGISLRELIEAGRRS
jgi:prevent-host-death family protein